MGRGSLLLLFVTLLSGYVSHCPSLFPQNRTADRLGRPGSRRLGIAFTDTMLRRKSAWRIPALFDTLVDKQDAARLYTFGRAGVHAKSIIFPPSATGLGVVDTSVAYATFHESQQVQDAVAWLLGRQ